jgi:16S rRNA processing protein RimM
MKKYLEIGKIVGTHNIKGEVRVVPWCDEPEFLCEFSELYFIDDESKVNLKLKVDFSRVHKSLVLLKLHEIDTLEQARQLIGKILYIFKKDVKLENGRYFIQDIIGSTVYDIDTKRNYGKITKVLKTGANDIYEVTSKSGKSYLIPVVSTVVIDVDIEKKEILIRPIEGIFENAD